MSDRINFAWDADDNINTYQLFEDGALIIDNIDYPNISLLMTDIEVGEHVYQVRGINQFGEGEFSDPVVINFTPPAKVQSLTYLIA